MSESRLIATAYLPGTGMNRALPSGGGRHLQFRGGAAYITNEFDMPAVLSMHGAVVEVEPKYVDFLAEWATKCPINTPAVARAHVSGAEGDNYVIGPAPEYAVTRKATPPVEPEREQPSAGPPWAPPRRVVKASSSAGQGAAAPASG